MKVLTPFRVQIHNVHLAKQQILKDDEMDAFKGHFPNFQQAQQLLCGSLLIKEIINENKSKDRE